MAPRTQARLLAALFLLVLGIGALGLFLGGGGVAEGENRRRNPAPGWPTDTAALLAWPRAAEAWVADRFGLREPLLRLHGALGYALRTRASRQRVLVGTEGWLFFGDRASRNSWQRTGLPDATELDAWRALWRERQAAARAAGAGYLFVAVPDKHSLYPRFMPADPPVLGETPRREVLRRAGEAALGERYLDLTQTLRAALDGPPLYHRTDSHWTPFGAQLGQRAIQQRLAALGRDTTPGPALPAEAFPAMVLRDGDLARLLAVTLPEPTLGLPAAPAACVARSEPMTLGAVDAVLPTPARRLRCGGAGPRLLLLHDSFGEALLPWLGLHHAEVVAVPLRAPPALFARLLAELQPDVVVEERVERLLDLRFQDRMP